LSSGRTCASWGDVAARKGAEVLSGVVRMRSLEPSRPLAAAFGGPAWLKCENRQRVGSYKVRGAYLCISRLTNAERAGGVVAASAGNHAPGGGPGSRHSRHTVHCVHARWRAAPKVATTRAHGAKVEFAGNTVDDSLVAAKEYADRTGAILIHRCDHPDVIAGQGTVGLEILEWDRGGSQR
jgi:threonine dehydratase